MDNTSFLPIFVVCLFLIIIIGYLNEKVIHKTYEIMLLLISVVIGAVATAVVVMTEGTTVSAFLGHIQLFNLEKFLMDSVLCFMLFAGSCHMKLSNFKTHARALTVMALLTTFLGAIFYGGLFYGVAQLFRLPFTLPMCLMFGSIVAPTDPIAATSILCKFGLPHDTSFLMEGESLLNDGVGVALFVCFSGMVEHQTGAEVEVADFFLILGREVIGAAVIGGLVSMVCYRFFRGTEESKLRVFVSLFAVAIAYLLCEACECSGAIASVICGVMFSYYTDREEVRGHAMALGEYDSFWAVIDNLLNSVLYIMLGLSFVRILQMEKVMMLSLAAVICNLIGRYLSVYISTFLMGRLPDGYRRGGFAALFTWGGLRGGLCIALAMSASGMLPDTAAHIVLGCTYAIVFWTTVIQGMTMPGVYEMIPRNR